MSIKISPDLKEIFEQYGIQTVYKQLDDTEIKILEIDDRKSSMVVADERFANPLAMLPGPVGDKYQDINKKGNEYIKSVLVKNKQLNGIEFNLSKTFLCDKKSERSSFFIFDVTKPISLNDELWIESLEFLIIKNSGMDPIFGVNLLIKPRIMLHSWKNNIPFTKEYNHQKKFFGIEMFRIPVNIEQKTTNRFLNELEVRRMGWVCGANFIGINYRKSKRKANAFLFSL